MSPASPRIDMAIPSHTRVCCARPSAVATTSADVETRTVSTLPIHRRSKSKFRISQRWSCQTVLADQRARTQRAGSTDFSVFSGIARISPVTFNRCRRRDSRRPRRSASHEPRLRRPAAPPSRSGCPQPPGPFRTFQVTGQRRWPRAR